MDIRKYVLVDAEDNEDDMATYDRLDEAIEAARKRGNTAVIARVFEYTDSELEWTPDGGDVWPPEKEQK